MTTQRKPRAISSKWMAAAGALALGLGLSGSAAGQPIPIPGPPIPVPAPVVVAPPFPPPPVVIATSHPVYYEGHASYWYGGRWHWRDAHGWHWYASEPVYLRDHRWRGPRHHYEHHR